MLIWLCNKLLIIASREHDAFSISQTIQSQRSFEPGISNRAHSISTTLSMYSKKWRDLQDPSSLFAHLIENILSLSKNHSFQKAHRLYPNSPHATRH
jgi:hypothetical protein